MIETERLTAFLKKIHLFNGLSDEQLGMVASQFTDESQEAGKIVFEEGMQGDTFYLIFSGRAVVFRKPKKGNEQNEKPLAILVAGDYFGEEALLTNQRRSASVRIQEDAILLSLPRAKFIALLKKIPQLKPNFENLGGKPEVIPPLAIQVGALRRGHLFSGAQTHHSFDSSRAWPHWVSTNSRNPDYRISVFPPFPSTMDSADYHIDHYRSLGGGVGGLGK